MLDLIAGVVLIAALTVVIGGLVWALYMLWRME